MNVVEALRIALRALRANRLRSVLTTTGIVIGVSAVIAMVMVPGSQQIGARGPAGPARDGGPSAWPAGRRP